METQNNEEILAYIGVFFRGPPVTIFLDLFPCAGYFLNAFD